MRHLLDTTVKVLFSLLLAGGILWWMYRGIAWDEMMEALRGEMRWEWMLLSMPFGIAAQVFRALRWRQVLEPLGERPRHTTCTYAVFLSYASSLLVPRVGEVLRCAVVRRWDGTGFTRSVGTVVSERVVDMLVVLVLSLATVCAQIPVFARFASATGISFWGVLRGFTAEGYVVTAVCVLLIVATGVYLFRRLEVLRGTQETLRHLTEGLLSVRSVGNKPLFAFYTLGIWVAYYLHFYLAFFCFSSTQGLGVMAALVAFVVGTFAVLVPTPNGAGAWHFAVKTVLVLYGVGATEGAMFVLIVHTLQTLLVLLLGLYALLALPLSARHRGSPVA